MPFYGLRALVFASVFFSLFFPFFFLVKKKNHQMLSRVCLCFSNVGRRRGMRAIEAMSTAALTLSPTLSPSVTYRLERAPSGRAAGRQSVRPFRVDSRPRSRWPIFTGGDA